MATKRGSKGKNPQDAIEAGRAAGGTGTATGQEANRRAGNEEIPKGKERGSTVKSSVPVAKKADYMGEGQPPIGKQLEPATFVGNGQIDTGMVASSSGPVPIASVVSTPEEGAKLEEKNIKDLAEQNQKFTRGKVLSDEQIGNMNAAELRAVGSDRGYTMSTTSGRRGTRAAFSEAQSKDKRLEK